MTERVHYEILNEGSTALASIHLDDGKANAMQDAFFAELNEALDRAESDAVQAVVMHGRDDFFSGGLDLKVLPDLSPDALSATTGRFGETMRRVFLFPKPVVAAASGYAIAGGMMLYLAADLRVALTGTKARFGLNEAVTGIPLLGGTAGLVQYAIPPAHHTELILHGRLIDATEMNVRGIAHDLVSERNALLPRAIARATELADLSLPTYRLNKRMLREPSWDRAIESAKGLAGLAPTENPFDSIRR